MSTVRLVSSARRVVAIAVVAAIVGAAGMSGSANGNHAPNAPVDLRVDESASPLWVTGAPTFGWIPTDPDRNEIQTAYRLVVATAPTTDPNASAVAFDSGRVRSRSESTVGAPGLRLRSDRRYWWTVRTWDRGGTAGPYARPVPFDTALTDSDWHADWIRRPEAPANPLEDYFLVRHSFVVGASAIVRARAYVSAGQQYELYVNGTRVDGGPSFAYPDEQYYQPTDITRFVQPGRTNVVAMVVHNLDAGQGRPAEPPGVIARVTVDHRDASRQAITTDGSWRVHEGPWLPAGPRNDEGDFVESIDARKVPGDWASTTFDDHSWEHAFVIGAHPTAPWTHLVAQRTRVVEHAVKPKTFRRLANGSYVADFGAVIAATPAVAIHAGRAGRAVKLLQGYLLDPDGAVSTTKGTQETDMHDDYIERAGVQTIRPFGYLGFRYLEVISAAEPLRASDVIAYARHSEMPDEAASAFSSSSSTLDRIWELARHSALYGSQEQFVDTPTRERGQFGQDSSNTSSVATIAFGDRNLTWQALRDFARSQKRYWPDGRVNAVYPNGDGKRDIPDLTENFASWVLRYYELTGDRQTLAALYPVAVNITSYIARAIVPATGLVTNLPGGGGDYAGGIVDWPIQERNGYDMTTAARTTENVIGIEAFRDVATEAAALGRPAPEISAQQARARSLTTAVNAHLRRADGVYIDGLHADGSASTHASQQANAYALAAGIAPAASTSAVVHQVESLGMAMGPDIAAVLLQALHASGNDQDLIELLTNPKIPGWAQTLSRGATFTWESWDARDVYGDSESHAWGSTVLPALLSDVLGVQTSAPGGARVDVTLPDTMLREASGHLATERGTVSVSWHRRSAPGVALDVTVPDNMTARVMLPVSGGTAVYESGGAVPNLKRVRPGVVRVVVGSGRYAFTVRGIGGDYAPPPKSYPSWIWFLSFALVVVALTMTYVVIRSRRHRRAA